MIFMYVMLKLTRDYKYKKHVDNTWIFKWMKLYLIYFKILYYFSTKFKLFNSISLIILYPKFIMKEKQ